MSKKKYHVRKFLNKTTGTAAIEIQSSYTAWNFDCGVSLSDCNRKIDLDFHMWNPKQVKQKLDKLNLLIDELVKLREYLEPATQDFINLNKNKKKGEGLLSILNEDEDD
jgi:hypothetical protein